MLFCLPYVLFCAQRNESIGIRIKTLPTTVFLILRPLSGWPPSLRTTNEFLSDTGKRAGTGTVLGGFPGWERDPP